MKRKENVNPAEKPLREVTDRDAETGGDASFNQSTNEALENIYILEEGKLKPFAAEDYTVSNLYQMIESFSVECKLVRPEDPSNVVYEGKKPSKKTVPVIVTKTGESLILDSWEALEAKPEQLTEAMEVIGVTPVKKIFVLRRQ